MFGSDMPKKKIADKGESYDEKYYIISRESVSELSRKVRKMIDSGAKPIGGVVIDDAPAGKQYIQAMTFD
jgi:hypothetical protein